MVFFQSPSRTRWNPWTELRRVHDEMSRLWSLPAQSSNTPPVNVWTSEDSARLVAVVPGFSAQDIDVSVTGDRVTLTGRHEALPDGDEVESKSTIEFERSFRLPFEIDSAQATCANGLLEVELSRAENAVRKIEVKPS